MKSKRIQALILAAAVAARIRGRGGLLGLGAAVGPRQGRRLRPRHRRLGLGSGGSGGSAGPVVATGPGGERLVRTTKFAALGAIWSMDCSSSCGGVAI